MRHHILGPMMLGALLAFDEVQAAPTCPHCGQRVGSSLDQQRIHATGACVSAPPIGEPIMIAEKPGMGTTSFTRREQNDRRHAEQRSPERQAAALKRIENAIAKRERKAASRTQSRKRSPLTPTEP